MPTLQPPHRQRRRAERSRLAGQMCSSAIAVGVLVIVLAGIFRFATGESPWPIFLLVELPSAATAFALLTLTAPR
ncbi:MAG TPA: hypothetical protein VKV26_15400 [Dehalococcoidia bacterium]|nr:hypothetical protein [Dehalococcoidia bacterium]